jgi:hypothetical protein
MSNGTDIAKQVAGAFAEAGTAVGDGPLEGILVRSQPADRSMPEIVKGEPVRFPVTVMQSRFTAFDRAAGVVTENDVRFRVAADREHPLPTDKIEVNGKTYSILTADPVGPGGVPLYFDVKARS